MKTVRIDTETRLAQDEVPELTPRGRKLLELGLVKDVYLGHYTRPGWRGKLPFYAFKCKIHGIVIDYPHGFKEELRCPKCETHWSWK